jgi:hypothetical protein
VYRRFAGQLIVNGPLAWGVRAPGPSSLLTRPLADDARSDHHRAVPGVDLLHLDPQSRRP